MNVQQNLRLTTSCQTKVLAREDPFVSFVWKAAIERGRGYEIIELSQTSELSTGISSSPLPPVCSKTESSQESQNNSLNNSKIEFKNMSDCHVMFQKISSYQLHS